MGLWVMDTSVLLLPMELVKHFSLRFLPCPAPPYSDAGTWVHFSNFLKVSSVIPIVMCSMA